MKQAQEPGKRIVSKGEYVWIQAARSGIGLAGWCAMMLSILSGVAAFLCTIAVAVSLMTAYEGYFEALMWVVIKVVLSVVFGVSAWFFWGVGVEITDRISKNNVVPLTRANTADLPANDSLVRASQEPAQVQQTILLRAAQNVATPMEQLVRPAAGQEQTGKS